MFRLCGLHTRGTAWKREFFQGCGSTATCPRSCTQARRSAPPEVSQTEHSSGREAVTGRGRCKIEQREVIPDTAQDVELRNGNNHPRGRRSDTHLGGRKISFTGTERVGYLIFALVRAAVTEYYRPGASRWQKCTSHPSEARRPRSRWRQIPRVERPVARFADAIFLPCGGGGGLRGVSFVRALIPGTRAVPQDPLTSQGPASCYHHAAG